MDGAELTSACRNESEIRQQSSASGIMRRCVTGFDGERHSLAGSGARNLVGRVQGPAGPGPEWGQYAGLKLAVRGACTVMVRRRRLVINSAEYLKEVF